MITAEEQQEQYNIISLTPTITQVFVHPYK